MSEVMIRPWTKWAAPTRVDRGGSPGDGWLAVVATLAPA